jgi:Tfp pilus assembly protein PilN
MIKINLLPEELLKSERGINPRLLCLYSLAGLFIVLIIIQVLLAIDFGLRSYRYRCLKSTWHRLSPERKKVDILKRKEALLSEDAKIMRRYLQQRVIWSPKMEFLSAALPQGMWFNKLYVDQQNFLLDASVVSLNKEEMVLIKRFLAALRKHKEFFSDFKMLELGAVKLRKRGNYEITDFTLRGKMK